MSDQKVTILEELNQKGDELKKDFFGNLRDTNYIKMVSLQGSTARAMHYKKCYHIYKPSSIYRNWVHYHFFEDAQVVEALKKDTNFETLHNKTVESLKDFWFKIEKRVKGVMPFYLFLKMTDLLFKSICQWEELPYERRQWLFNHVHVPIDKYSLICLDEFHDKYEIPNPSMNYIGNDIDLYYQIQNDIEEMVRPHPPMLFDLYAWNYRRGQMILDSPNFELIHAEKE